MNKNLYEKPITDVLVIRFEDNLLLSNTGDNEGFNKDANPYSGGWTDED